MRTAGRRLGVADGLDTLYLVTQEGRFDLRVRALLRAIPDSRLYHQTVPARHPLGIYNVSTGLLLSRLRRLIAEAQEIILSGLEISEPQPTRTGTLSSVLDTVELSLYAAAAHVDDIETIARCLYRSTRESNASGDIRWLRAQLKPIRDRLAGLANHLKHSHNRIRLFLSQLITPTGTLVLPGFFLESSDGKQIGANPHFHSDGNPIISLTYFCWEQLLFLTRCCNVLEGFLARQGLGGDSDSHVFDSLIDPTLRAISRLPIYSFHNTGGLNLSGMQIHFTCIPDVSRPSIPGSPLQPFDVSQSNAFRMGSSSILYGGDGVSRSFQMNFAKVANFIPSSVAILPTTAAEPEDLDGESVELQIIHASPVKPNDLTDGRATPSTVILREPLG